MKESKERERERERNRDIEYFEFSRRYVPLISSFKSERSIYRTNDERRKFLSAFHIEAPNENQFLPVIYVVIYVRSRIIILAKDGKKERQRKK